ncbi:MAG: class I SAM-dependent methyltransferase [Candidatus Omnitrophota bacterium]
MSCHENISRQLKLVKKFDSSEPDFSHKVSFVFAREYIENKVVLNIGCWTGGFEKLLKGVNCRFVGVDINAEVLKIAKKANPQFDYVESVVQKLPFADGFFDTVMMFAVLEHLPINHEVKAFKEVARVLKKGGTFILTTPFYHWQSNILDVAYWMVGHRHYKIQDIKEMLNEAGFVMEKAEARGGLLGNLSLIPFYLIKYLFHLNLYKSRFFSRLLEKEYYKKGNKDIFLIGKKI